VRLDNNLNWIGISLTNYSHNMVDTNYQDMVYTCTAQVEIEE